MKSAITLCQVPEAIAGPFVFRSPLPEAFAAAAAMGFDAVELFLPGPDFISTDEVKSLADEHGLAIAAVGTGAGWVCRGLSLTDPSAEIRSQAWDYIRAMIDFGGILGAPAILGSMQGKFSPTLPRDAALGVLAEALQKCSDRAAFHGVPFLYEPLNRYETNLINSVADAAEFLNANHLKNVLVLADLFHMNIEEPDLPAAIRAAGARIGHVHWADSNRRAIGYGHTHSAAILAALREIGYRGYLSAEILPLPDPGSAARQTIYSLT